MNVPHDQLDLPKLFKRLEILKSLILLEETGELETHHIKLKEFASNRKVIEIDQLLTQKKYGEAIAAIDCFMGAHQQVIFYTDNELHVLKVELKSLESRLNQLSGEKADLEKLLHEFALRHNRELGALIIEILEANRRKAKGTADESSFEKEYYEYSRQFEEAKEQVMGELSEDELLILKLQYRKASKLCHPDMVSDEQKEVANRLFAELNKAYESNDLQRVCGILTTLQEGKTLINRFEMVNEKKLVRIEIEKLRSRIRELESEIDGVIKSEAYNNIIKITDWDGYFRQAKQKLAQQIIDMEHARQ